MVHRTGLTGLILSLLGALITFSGAAFAPPAQQSSNLLTNPSFEAPYYEFVIPNVANGYVANGWSYWWLKEQGDEMGIPEYKEARASLEPRRVQDGQSAQVYYKKWSLHVAGLYQRVEVPANSRLVFSAYGMAWSTFSEPPVDQYDSFTGDGANYVFHRVGIDPTGGTNPFSIAVVWGEADSSLDSYSEFTVEATAKGSFVTVYVWSSPQYPAATVDVFWDDASLIASGSGVANFVPSSTDQGSGSSAQLTPQPVGTPVPEPTSGAGGGGYNPNEDLTNVTPVPAQPPEPDGSQYHVVQPLDSILRIAKTYGVTAQTIRELNNLRTDTIQPGQRLLIKLPLSDATPVPEEGGETGEAPSEGEGEGAPTEQVLSDTQICLVLFDDLNRDGVWGQGEPLLAEGTFEVDDRQETSYSYTTDGKSEPHCFTGLKPGSYTLSFTPPEGYDLTGNQSLPVTLNEGGQVALSVGAASLEGIEAEPPPSSGGRIPWLMVVLVAAGLGLVIAGIGAGWMLARRGQDQEAPDEETAAKPDDLPPPEDEG